MPLELKKDTMGILAWSAGILTITITLIVQLWTIDHGSSGQLAIQSGLNTALWPGLTGVALLGVGMMLWLLFTDNERYKYPALFILAISSYIMANFAILFSTKQVTVANV